MFRLHHSDFQRQSIMEQHQVSKRKKYDSMIFFLKIKDPCCQLCKKEYQAKTNPIKTKKPGKNAKQTDQTKTKRTKNIYEKTRRKDHEKTVISRACRSMSHLHCDSSS